ncbi:hypothetical protein EDF39_0472 [Frondihabitans sp. PhB161]|nr:hypothetical protein EDF37_0471 [Frondihabitans sp. PhB153]RPF08088.1 hypothetical protein EDF39_0472 [Frondihabitans sp. PhB161]
MATPTTLPQTSRPVRSRISLAEIPRAALGGTLLTLSIATQCAAGIALAASWGLQIGANVALERGSR